jgi:hypothetical protein
VDGGLLVDYELGLRERLNRFLQHKFPLDLIMLSVKPDRIFAGTGIDSNSDECEEQGSKKLVVEYHAPAHISAEIIEFFGLTGTSIAAKKVVRTS